MVNVKKGEQRRTVSVSRATKLIAEGWSFDVNIPAEKAPIPDADCGCWDKVTEELIEEPIVAVKKKRKRKGK